MLRLSVYSELSDIALQYLLSQIGEVPQLYLGGEMCGSGCEVICSGKKNTSLPRVNVLVSYPANTTRSPNGV